MLVERRGDVVWLTINRPEARNAMNAAVVKGLLSAVRGAGSEPGVRALVLTGAGERAFSAGGDLGGFSTEASRIDLHYERKLLAELVLALRDLPFPTLARVNGHALGGGFGLVLACDLAVASEGAELGTPEVRVGLWPYIISALVLRALPEKKAMELMMTGGRISAQEALALGLVNRVVPREELDKAVEEMLEAVLSKSPVVLRLGKESFYAAREMELREALAYLSSMLTVGLEVEDAVEGVLAFLEKREPRWRGR